MTSEKICNFNKYGHCKFKDTCRFKHVNTICEIEICNDRSCERRHPRTCNFFRDYNRCKFFPCSYKHVEHVPEAVNDKLRELKETLKQKETEIMELRNLIEATNEHVKVLERKSNDLEMKIREIDERTIATKMPDFCFKPVNDEISFNQDTHGEEQPTTTTSPPLSSQEHIPQLDGLHSSVDGEEKCSTCELYFYSQEELSNYMKENSIYLYLRCLP